MSCRGTFGFTFKNELKAMYLHDSHPLTVGESIVAILERYNLEELRAYFERVVMVNEIEKPSYSAIKEHKNLIGVIAKERATKLGLDNFMTKIYVESYTSPKNEKRMEEEWYWLMRIFQDAPDSLVKYNIEYMCELGDNGSPEYEYLIDLEKGSLVFSEEGVPKRIFYIEDIKQRGAKEITQEMVEEI